MARPPWLPATSEAGARHLNCLHMMSQEAMWPHVGLWRHHAPGADHLQILLILSFREAAASMGLNVFT